MVTFTTGIMFALLACSFWRGEFYEGGPLVRQPPVKWSAIVEIFRNTAIEGSNYGLFKDLPLVIFRMV
jgi:hypothetical protein